MGETKKPTRRRHTPFPTTYVAVLIDRRRRDGVLDCARVLFARRRKLAVDDAARVTAVERGAVQDNGVLNVVAREGHDGHDCVLAEREG